jgi:D-arabinose 1-dehydrogenase-like Zn-dependent alcohol dehydrogenase
MASTVKSLALKSALLGAALYGLPRVLPERFVENLPVGEKILKALWAVAVLRDLSMLFWKTKDDKSWDCGKEVVVVTGGSSGIGELIVKYLAEKGVKVAVLDVNPPKSTHGKYSFSIVREW